jgi:succinate dehydrogenase/fumarate reductase flavoprotein subunit
LKDGKPCLIRSRAVLLSAGGAGAIYSRNDNQKSILGDGYTLTLRAGLPLFDLEFVQFYPFALGEPRLSTLLLYPPFPRSQVIDEKGGSLSSAFEGFERSHDYPKRQPSSPYTMLLRGDVFDLTQVRQEKWEHYP